jgi:hypothetical protein
MSVSKVTFSDQQWGELLQQIEQGECTPFIGPEAFASYIPPTVRAEEWAAANNYPLQDLEDSHVLAKVAQYLAINNPDKDYLYPKRVLSQALKKVPIPNFASKDNQNTPYAVLADLPFSIYITTNYDYFMEEALKSKNRKYVSDFCRWNGKLADYAERILGLESKLKRSEYVPTKDNALVYHLHGNIDIPISMVLTEKDYIAFAIQLNKEETITLPPLIRKALATTKLLFIGYSLEDLTFRVIFHGISMLLDVDRPVSFAVQLPPTFSTEEKQKLAQEYLNSYTNDMFKVVVYWKDTQQFIEELRIRWDNYQANKGQ